LWSLAEINVVSSSNLIVGQVAPFPLNCLLPKQSTIHSYNFNAIYPLPNGENEIKFCGVIFLFPSVIMKFGICSSSTARLCLKYSIKLVIE